MYIRRASSIAVLSFFLPWMTSCQRAIQQPDPGIEIVTTLPVFASIAGELVSENDSVTPLIISRESPHSFQPKPSDIRRLERSDIVLLSDRALDDWASGLSPQKTFFLTDLLDETAILTTGGYRNPHFWMDPILVNELIHPLADILCRQREGDCTSFHQRADDFGRRLQRLDVATRATLSSLTGQSVVTSHPFFDYFLARYGIRSTATLEPLPGHLPSPREIIKVLKLVREVETPLFLLSQSPVSGGTMELIAQESGLPIIYLNSAGKTGQSYYAFIADITRLLTTQAGKPND